MYELWNNTICNLKYRLLLLNMYGFVAICGMFMYVYSTRYCFRSSYIYTFVINLLCLMTQQPDIISVEKSASKYVATTNKGFASKKMNNVPNVHWLGADFTTRVQYSKKINTDPSDISRGKPKRSHWRRGHWHTISQGPGRLQKKLRWFQPVFIKGHKEEAN